MDRRTLEKRYDQVLQEAQFLRSRCNHLEQQARVDGPELYRSYQKIDRLEQRLAKVEAENVVLNQRVKELTLASRTHNGTTLT